MADFEVVRSEPLRHLADRHLASDLARSVMFMPDQDAHDSFVNGVMTLLRGFDPAYGGTRPNEFACNDRRTVTAEILARILERSATFSLVSGESNG